MRRQSRIVHTPNSSIKPMIKSEHRNNISNKNQCYYGTLSKNEVGSGTSRTDMAGQPNNEKYQGSANEESGVFDVSL